MSNTLLERFVAQLNQNVFFAEFAFDSAQIRVPGKGDVEIADHLVIVDELGILFQLKERSPVADSSASALRTWFAQKVRKKAVTQIHDTRLLLREFAGAEVRNQRGHKVKLQAVDPTAFPAVVVYEMPSTSGFVAPQFCVSERAGFVHLIRAADYLGVCQYLVTPIEVIDYLKFREDAARALAFVPERVSEAALVGQYMGGDLKALPQERFAGALTALIDDRSKWDVSFLTDNLGAQIALRAGDDLSDTSHYRILAELAKLSRSELRALKERLAKCTEALRKDEFVLPFRFSVPRTDCGFMLFPVERAQHDSMKTGLHHLSLASKHEFKVRKHIGVALKKDGRYLDILWMYAEGPCAPNPELDAALRDNNPFRRTSYKEQPRYFFDTEALRAATDVTPDARDT